MNRNILRKLCALFLFLGLMNPSFAQVSSEDSIELDGDDLNIGGDIFSDFNEVIESHQQIEDERFFRYGRFFSFQFGIGFTSFDGNRGEIYEDEHPTFTMSLNYFLDFQTAFSLGIAFSKHNMFFAGPTQGIFDQFTDENDTNRETGFGIINVEILRVFLGYRFYFDTHNLGTAITYSNPYFVLRAEYWYLTNKFEDQPSLEDDSGGGLGGGIGVGLEFPIKLKESYLNVELIYHFVNLHDKLTQDYQEVEKSIESIEDLTGNALDFTASYVWSW